MVNRTSSIPPPTRSTRDLSIQNTSDHSRPSSGKRNANDDNNQNTVRIETITERDMSNHSYQDRMSRYTSSMGRAQDGEGSSHHRRGRRRDEDDSDDDGDDIVQLLALQVYHLPGNSWCQDWYQYMTNNHPIFGICCHDKRHPIGAKTRIVALIGTVLFGLAMTNFFYLFYLWNPEFDRVVATMVTGNGETFSLTTGMLLLWTLGGGIHTAVNLFMWHLAACMCCRQGGFCEKCACGCFPSLGKHMLRVFVLGTLSACVMIILLRVAINGHKEEYGIEKGVDIRIDDQITLEVHSVSEFSFVTGYLVEMALAFIVYYPIGGTMLFSGMIGCFYKIPVLGGRPYEVYCEQKRKTTGVVRGGKKNRRDLEHGTTRESIEVSVI